MANEQNSGYTPQPPFDERRHKVADDPQKQVKFVDKKISQERLDALKEFLRTATADDIATIRRLYGDNPEVLSLIGLEMTELPSEKEGR